MTEPPKLESFVTEKGCAVVCYREPLIGGIVMEYISLYGGKVENDPSDSEPLVLNGSG